MSNDGVNHGRRRLLLGTTAVGGAVAGVGVAVPYIASWNPSERAKAAGAPAKADIGQLEPGQQLIVAWRGKPVWIVRRSQETLDNLAKLNDRLSDPQSVVPQQPAYAQNEYRSQRPEILVLEGVCTHLGCSPKYRPDVEAQPFDSEWLGGFYCPCHGSRFDLAGRVFSGVPAPTNLVVPPHKYVGDSVIIIGVDEEKA
jgi:ubiquinol-cytochrome c reductase iron-sulfur subunit